MIYKKTWFKWKNNFRKKYAYTGWFLLGFIPLFISRKEVGN